MLFVVFLQFTEFFSASEKLSCFSHKGPYGPGKWAAVLRGFLSQLRVLLEALGLGQH